MGSERDLGEAQEVQQGQVQGPGPGGAKPGTRSRLSAEWMKQPWGQGGDSAGGGELLVLQPRTPCGQQGGDSAPSLLR